MGRNGSKHSNIHKKTEFTKFCSFLRIFQVNWILPFFLKIFFMHFWSKTLVQKLTIAEKTANLQKRRKQFIISIYTIIFEYNNVILQYISVKPAVSHQIFLQCTFFKLYFHHIFTHQLFFDHLTRKTFILKTSHNKPVYSPTKHRTRKVESKK